MSYRAKGPEDRLGGRDALPVPIIIIGMKVAPAPLSAYQRAKIVRSQIRDLLRILASLRAEGYLSREPGSKILPDFNKDQIRASMRVIDTAYEVQVAGVVCVGHHLGRTVVNQCYVGGGQGWSGADFYGQLLFRAEDDQGRRVCVLQPLDTVPYTFSQHDLAARAL